MTAVVVTGAGRGIGAAIAARLASRHRVVAVDVAFAVPPEDGVSQLVRDVTADDAFDDVRDWLLAGEQLAGWVNNAALALPGALHEADRTDVDRTWAVNVGSYFWGSSAAVRLFLEQSSPGSIVNISSIQATHAFPGWAAYVSAKGAVDALTRYIAVEYGGAGIRCNAVAPGNVRTPLAAAVVDSANQPSGMQRVMDEMAPLLRMAEPTEIANAVAFLLSGEASYTNGHVMVIDGGATARCLPLASVGNPHGDLGAGMGDALR